jgi:hypothetical protein
MANKHHLPPALNAKDNKSLLRVSRHQQPTGGVVSRLPACRADTQESVTPLIGVVEMSELLE